MKPTWDELQIDSSYNNSGDDDEMSSMRQS